MLQLQLQPSTFQPLSSGHFHTILLVGITLLSNQRLILLGSLCPLLRPALGFQHYYTLSMSTPSDFEF